MPNIACDQCGSIAYKKQYFLDLNNKNFCTADCFRLYKRENKTTKERPCFNCSKPVFRMASQIKRSKSGKVYCSRHCATVINNQNKTGHNHPNFKNGDARAYRKKALRHYGIRCMSAKCPCPNDLPVIAFDVDHIDGDRLNNSIENLQVLCVVCHAIKTRSTQTNPSVA